MGLILEDSIIGIAMENNIAVFYAMAFFAVMFLVCFFLATFSPPQTRRHAISSSILKYAPSIMTALGLFGTFYELTNALQSFEPTPEAVEGFIAKLKPVFTFSILGILSAVIFMVLNFIAQATTNAKISSKRLQDKAGWNRSQNESKTKNQQVIDELKNQNQYLSGLSSIPDSSEQQNQRLQSGFELLAKQAKMQHAKFSSLEASLQSMAQALGSIETGYDKDELGRVIADNVGAVLRQPLADIASSLEQNNKDTIEGLLRDLKQEVLVPIKDEIGKTTIVTSRVINVIKESQQTNSQLISELQDVTGAMQSFVGQTETVVNSMEKTVSDMQKVQSDQKGMLEKFNTDLGDNLAGIQPAIEGGMNTAKTAMVGAIEKTTGEMNDAMTGVIDSISTKVVDKLDEVLTDFNGEMNSHLKSMDNVLKTTGNEAKDLMNGAATNLQNSLGNIHKTIEASSTKLQKELEEFRKEYQVSLTSFFEQQNEQLENTLGVHNSALQGTADDFRQQFENMTTVQKRINEETQTFVTELRPTYESLLNQMASISTDLGSGQSRLVKNLSDTIDHTDKINDALHQLGNTLPQKFTESFDDLNREYIEKIENSNEFLEKMMKETIVAAAALLTATTTNNANKTY